MNKKSILKVGIVVLIIGMIFMQIYRIEANSSFSFSDLMEGNELTGANEILSENGENSSLNTATANKAVTNTTNTANLTNTTNTARANNTTNTNRNTALPQTGTNENIIIALMVIFAVVGVYTFKKVRDYNI